MDPQKSAANRVRHVLQAMERSIDSARSRRVGHATPVDQALAPRMPGVEQSRPILAASHTSAAQSSPQPASQLMIGASPQVNTHPAAPVTRPGVPQLAQDGQPQRLKAKPKRFDGGASSAFAPPPAYRSQAG
jgi:hypothetical protein